MPNLNLDRLDHLVLTVRDVDQTCAFYQRVLGMEIETFGRGRTALRFGRHKINVEHADRPTPIHLCFITNAPLADWIDHLKACAVVLRDGPVKRSGAEGPIDSIYLDDPDQNSIEVSTYPAPSQDRLCDLDRIVRELVIANRILANENVVDAYGHVSHRHPDDPGRYLLARSVSPELVERGDIVEFTLDGLPTGEEKRALYLERFIHGAIYEARPDVMAVVHAHAEAVLPFTVTKTPLRPVIHSGSFMGPEVPVWDIADRFGDTNLLVANMAQGRDLARGLGGNNVVLMRGHGFAAAARTLIEVVRMSVYTPRNARALLAALALGEVKPLSLGEINARNAGYKPYSPETQRAWEYWARRAGCGDMLS